jgi:hypothetical protein
VLQSIEAVVIEESVGGMGLGPFGILGWQSGACGQRGFESYPRIQHLERQAAVKRSSSERRTGRQPGNLGANERRDVLGVIAGRHQGIDTGIERGLRSVLVDSEVVYHRLHGKRHAVLHVAVWSRS